MAVKGGKRQPTAPDVPATAIKSILLEVQRKKEGKGTRGLTGARATEGGDSGMRTGGQVQTGKVGKGQVGVSGARQAAGHQEGKGGKGGGKGRQWPQSQQSFRQLPPGSPPQVSAAVRVREEREARCQQTAQYEALAHMERQRRRCRPPKRLRPTPSASWRWGQGGKAPGARVRRRGQVRSTAANPVADCREGKGRLRRAAKQRRGATASGREDMRVEGRSGTGQGYRARRKRQEHAR